MTATACTSGTRDPSIDVAAGRAAAPRIQGWCPGALRPMASGDGLVVRVRARQGAVALDTLAALADIARRLGESELVANAIGSHHADEPANSVYAYLVAAADAMSGARPGARREQTEGFSTKIEELERIGERHRGVDAAHAVQGGRELRVYVRERDVDDAGVVALSSEIAAQVSDELVFPGQIKITVIRETRAVEYAK